MWRALKLLLRQALIVIFLLASGFAPVHAQNAELTVEDYCQLTRSLMELSVGEWQDRVSALGQVKGGPVEVQSKGGNKELLGDLEKISSRHRRLRNQLYKEFKIGRRAYLSFASDHRVEIESYLEEHPEVRADIDSIKDRINRLIEQFESAMSARKEGAKQ